MSNPNHCFHSNPDISGIGVRAAVYTQNLLSFVPAFFALLNDGVVTQIELDILETQSSTILITALALLISTMVQAFNKGVTYLHAPIILNLSWMNNTNLFIYFSLYVHNRLTNFERAQREDSGSGHNGRTSSVWAKEMKRALFNPVFIFGSAHLSIMATVGFRFWHQPLSFGDSPPCSQPVWVVIAGHQILLTSEGLKGWSLFIYSLLLVPISNLFVPTTLFSAPFFISRLVSPSSSKQKRSLGPTMAGLVVLAAINIVLIADTEATLQINSHLVDRGDTDWTFGQTLALLLLLVPLRDLVETLIKRRPRRVGKVLLKASSEGNLGAIKLAYDLGADPNMKDPCLRVAAKNGHSDVVRFLLENDNANVNATDQLGQTPLMFAAQNGHIDVVKVLLEKGANAEAKDQHGQTPLMFAVQNGHSSIIKALKVHLALVLQDV